MASTVEPCESNPPGISSLSSTLEMFDTFKSCLKDEDKDSDEESFHLPMLGCDDDTDSNNKDITSGPNTPVAENEDDILNKFETTATPDLDPTVEESILKDIDDEVLSTNQDENNETENDKLPDVATENSEGEKKNKVDEHYSESKSKDDIFRHLEIVDELDGDDDQEETQEDSNETETSKNVETKDCHDNEEISENAQEVDITVSKNGEDEDEKNTEEIEDSANENVMLTKNESTIVEATDVNQPAGDSEMNEPTHDDITKNSGDPVEEMNVDESIAVDSSNEDTKHCEEPTKEVDGVEEQSMDVDVQASEEDSCVLNGDKDVGNAMTDTAEGEPEGLITSSSLDVKNTDEPSEKETKMSHDEDNDRMLKGLAKEVNEKLDVDEIMPDVSIPDKQIKSNVDDGAKDENSADTGEQDNSSANASATVEDITSDPTSSVEESDKTNAADSKDTAMEIDSVNESDKQTDPEKPPKTSSSVQKKTPDESVSERTEPPEEKEEPSSKKSIQTDADPTGTSAANLECDDLLDVSVIKDLDEDDADAIEENTAQSSEKSDNDDQEDDKADNEIDESEVDQEENVNSSDKDERVDSEDCNSNMCDQEISTNDDLTNDAIGDSESKSNDDVVMRETEQQVAPENSSNVDKKDDSVQLNKPNENKEEGLSLGKRPLSDRDDVEIASKKFRLSDVRKEEKSTEKTATEKIKKTSSKSSNLKTLISFESFMQSKKFSNTKLTRSDLEQFCLQKICEAIMHKTDVGELNQTIKKQEQIIENLRKDLLQLSKQARDLDIVNKKLMNELKIQNGTRKPLVPLKITRSVGLQVKLNVGIEQTPRRKQPNPVNTPKTPTTPANNASVLRNRNITSANANVVRQVHQTSVAATATTPTPPVATPRKPASNTPILSQALQNRPTPIAPKRPPIRPKAAAEPPKPANPGVIDLTDEDDRAAKSAQQQAKSAPQAKSAQQVKAAQAAPMKILNKSMPVVQQRTVNIVQNKAGNKMVGQPNAGQQMKTGTRTVTTLPQGVRLTSTQLKNGLTLPASVVTSNASGTPQLMYVVQPSSLVTSTAGGTQKTVLLNFQPTSQVITSTINGSTVSMLPSKANTVQLKTIVARKHPAPLPLPPPAALNSSLKPLLPKPHLSIRKTDTGIILQWRMPYNLDVYEGIASYQLFAYQETNAPPNTDMWRKVGDVKALALPMACTLTQFADKNKYYFAVRSVDVHKRIGAFSDPEEISL